MGAQKGHESSDGFLVNGGCVGDIPTPLLSHVTFVRGFFVWNSWLSGQQMVTERLAESKAEAVAYKKYGNATATLQQCCMWQNTKRNLT